MDEVATTLRREALILILHTLVDLADESRWLAYCLCHLASAWYTTTTLPHQDHQDHDDDDDGHSSYPWRHDTPWSVAMRTMEFYLFCARMLMRWLFLISSIIYSLIHMQLQFTHQSADHGECCSHECRATESSEIVPLWLLTSRYQKTPNIVR